MKLIRWSAVIPTLVLVLLVWLFAIFLVDPITKHAIVSAGEATFGAKVDITSVRVSFLNTSLRIQGLQVADKNAPMTNLFEMGVALFDARALPLLEKKVVIDDASIKGIRFGTPRKTSGALPAQVQEKPGVARQAADRLWSQVETVSFDKFNDIKAYTDPKTIVNPDQLKVTAVAKQAQDELKKKPEALQAELTKLNAQARGEALKQKVNGLSGGINDAAGLLKKLDAVKSVQSDLNSLKSDIASTQQAMKTQIQSAQALVDQVKKAKEDDFKKLKENLSIPTLDQASLTRALLGPAVARHLERVITLTETAKAHMPASAQKPPPPPRGKGRVIEFPRFKDWPGFLLVKSELSGEWGQESPIPFLGKIEGITSNPPLYGKPAVLTVAGSKNGRSMNARVLADLTQTVTRFGLQASYDGLAIRDYALGQPNSLALLIKEGTGHLKGNVDLVGDVLSGDVRFQANQVQATPEMGAAGNSAIAQRIQNSIRQSLGQIHTLTLDAVVSGTAGSPNFALRSNLGEILSGAMKSAVGAEFSQQEKALRAELDRVSDVKIKELSSQLDGLSQQFLGPLAGQNKVVDDLLQQVKQQAAQGVGGGKATPDKAIQSIKGLFGR